MGFLRKLATVMGFHRDEAHGGGYEEFEILTVGDEDAPRQPTRGLSMQVPVNVKRPNLGPVVVPCSLGEGGVQGFRWYGRLLRMDEDGDVADEFLDEFTPDTSSNVRNPLAPPRFQVKYNTRPAPVRKLAIVLDGNIRQSIEHQGTLLWV